MAHRVSERTLKKGPPKQADGEAERLRRNDIQNWYLTQDLELVYRDPRALKRNKRSARKQTAKHVQRVAKAILTFGFNDPIIIDEEDNVLAGNVRLEAAIELGMAQVPTICISHLNEAEKRAYILAANKLAELAGWDERLLRIELGELVDLDLKGELSFDLEVIGFEAPEIDILLDDAAPDAMAAADATLADAEQEGGPVIAARGDLYILDRHMLLCADALEAESYTQLMGETRARVCFTDPPYNVPINGHVSGLGATRHREFAMASGEMSTEEFTQFLGRFLNAAANASVDGALLYVCIDWRHVGELLRAGEEAGLTLKNICTWVKLNGGMGSMYRSRHELVCVFKSGKGSHINNIQLGRHGRYRTNVWEYDGVNGFRKGRMEDLAAHPTVKPTALVADAIKDCTNRGDIVLDPFAGSGTTILAAERTGRIARAIELDPRYVDTAIRRWQALTGGHAIHEASGESFAAREAAVLAKSDQTNRAEGDDQ